MPATEADGGPAAGPERDAKPTGADEFWRFRVVFCLIPVHGMPLRWAAQALGHVSHKAVSTQNPHLPPAAPPAQATEAQARSSAV